MPDSTRSARGSAEEEVHEEGATGEVFRGELDGVPIAAKCLKLPPAATSEARAELNALPLGSAGKGD
jgi:hypothetical protein